MVNTDFRNNKNTHLTPSKFQKLRNKNLCLTIGNNLTANLTYRFKKNFFRINFNIYNFDYCGNCIIYINRSFEI